MPVHSAVNTHNVLHALLAHNALPVHSAQHAHSAMHAHNECLYTVQFICTVHCQFTVQGNSELLALLPHSEQPALSVVHCLHRMN